MRDVRIKRLMRITNVKLVQGYHSDEVIFDIGTGKQYALTNVQIEQMLVEYDLMCGECGDTGEVFDDEFENGQLVGRGTVSRKCDCQRKEIDHEAGD